MVGFDVDADVRAAIGQVRADCWAPALHNTDGTARDDADVAEITELMQQRLARTGWPRRLRVIVRRTRLAPGEQPTLFHLDGYKYSCFMTTTTSLNLQLLDARHRAHARVEDQVRTTKDTGLGHLPSKSWQVNSGWCQAVAIAARPAGLVQAARLDRRAGPRRTRDAALLLGVPARLTRGQRRRWLRLPRHWPWAEALATAIDKIRQLPLPTPQPG